MTTSQRVYNVLFLCTGNSARSILAEAIINHVGNGRFHGFSAGSFPKSAVHPVALQLLTQLKLPVAGLRSKSWDEFAASGAANLDFVFTVCDNAAGEVCPYWPGQPATAHWGYADPSEVQGTDAQRLDAFRQTLHAIRRRLELLVNLPPQSVDKLMLQTSARSLAKS